MLQTFLEGIQAPFVIIVGALSFIGILSLRKLYKDRKNKKK